MNCSSSTISTRTASRSEGPAAAGAGAAGEEVGGREFRQGKSDMESGAPVRLAFDADFPLVLFDNAVANAEAEAGAAVVRLGGEEGIKDAPDSFARNAVSGVPNGNHRGAFPAGEREGQTPGGGVFHGDRRH